MRVLGVESARVPAEGEWLELSGPARFVSPKSTIDCGNSGTSARMLIGLLAGLGVNARLDGDASLRRRPMARVLEPLRAAGAEIRELGEPGRLPLEIAAARIRAIEHESEVASAQVKSAMLLAGLTAGVPVTLVEPGPSRDHTERMLRAMNVDVETESVGAGRRVSLRPRVSAPRPFELDVPGDISSAAFFVALAALAGAAALRIEEVGLNPGRIGFLRAIEAMGADVGYGVTREATGEPVGWIVARPSQLEGSHLPPEWMPTLLDEVPVLACLAARARGTTVIRGAEELRVKESDRIATLCRNLGALGVEVEELADGLAIKGTEAPLRGRVETEGDHRIAMAFGVLSALPENDIEIDDRACAEISYPSFWSDLTRISEGMAAR